MLRDIDGPVKREARAFALECVMRPITMTPAALKEGS